MREKACGVVKGQGQVLKRGTAQRKSGESCEFAVPNGDRTLAIKDSEFFPVEGDSVQLKVSALGLIARVTKTDRQFLNVAGTHRSKWRSMVKAGQSAHYGALCMPMGACCTCPIERMSHVISGGS